MLWRNQQNYIDSWFENHLEVARETNHVCGASNKRHLLLLLWLFVVEEEICNEIKKKKKQACDVRT